MKKRSVLILGASYSSLLATKLAMAGHAVSLVCTRTTADLINRDGTVVRFPLRGSDPIDIPSSLLPGEITARSPEHTNPSDYDLVILGMQEAQYGADGVRELMRRIAKSRRPCLAIMNMPPLPYLNRIPGLDTAALAGCYADASVWEGFDPARITLASPDAQAFRPAGLPKNVLHVGLPTNFKAARFESEEHTELLRELEADIEQARYTSTAWIGWCGASRGRSGCSATQPCTTSSGWWTSGSAATAWRLIRCAAPPKSGYSPPFCCATMQ